MIEHSINKEIIDLWENEFKNDETVLQPLLYSSLEENSILFIGLNPSFSLKGFDYLLKNNPDFSTVEPAKFYSWSNRRDLSIFNKITALKIEKIAKDKYPYFKRFREIADSMELKWEHIDLFFYRQTSQKDFKKIIYKNGNINKFGERQLELSEKLIVGAKPRVIIVANALASEIFLKHFKKMEFNNNYCYYTIEIDNRIVPVFLASMLTGQRAMDNHSYKRLCWHIKKSISHFSGSF